MTRTRSERRSNALFTQLVEVNSGRLLAYFARRVDIPSDAADLLSDTFIVAWRRRRELPADDETGQLMWLYRVAGYVLANHQRAHRRSNRLTEELRSALSEHADDHSPDTDLRITVERALAQIDPASAEIVRLVHWDGLAVTDAATVLGLTASGARSRYATARTRLRRLLTASQEEGSPTWSQR